MRKSDGLRLFGRELEPALPVSTDPDWVQARLPWIEAALERALALPSGGWYVVGASRDIGATPRRYRIAGNDHVVWRTGSTIVVAPDTCPHMGASLSDGPVRDGRVVCPWHGLALGEAPHGKWRPMPSHDDGVLVWARLDPSEEPLPAPILPPRPERFLDAVLQMEARCDPEDVIANRLDPWHGVHFHPHSFARLRVIDQPEDSVTVRVVYRIFGRLGMEVDARFHCPEPRTIVMTIVGGEGVGSVVETHATPIEPGRSLVTEATLATSDRPGFHAFVRLFRSALRPLVRRRAHRLWIEDAAYAERRFRLRTRGER
jgi:isorenieratene synthase